MARYDNRREYKKDLYRRNQNIRVPEVRLINSDGTMIGVMPVAQAIALAKEQELDLVEISPNAQPPVCKIYLITTGTFTNRERKRRKPKRNRPK